MYVLLNVLFLASISYLSSNENEVLYYISQWKETVTAFSANKYHRFLITYFSHGRFNIEVQRYFTFMLELCFKLNMRGTMKYLKFIKIAIFVVSCNEFALYRKALLIKSVHAVVLNVTLNLKCSNFQFKVMHTCISISTAILGYASNFMLLWRRVLSLLWGKNIDYIYIYI